MAKKTYEKCMECILADIDFRREVDYLDRGSVRRYNAAMDRIYKNARYIDTYYPEKIDSFVELLNWDDQFIVRHIMPIIFKLNSCTAKHRAMAIAAAYRMLDHPDVKGSSKLGIEMNLETWKSMMQSDSQ